ncbi:MAG: hypothetical protein HY391_01440, partial [Deltaproteobacteria bacterium]|nr:hypothetical protein [Deltaproteobacteria bacterium]
AGAGGARGGAARPDRGVAAGGGRKNVRVLGEGVFEIKIKYGPGFRVYFGEEGMGMILLILGGHKGSQSRDIEMARQLWRNYVSK